ncbi:hypothetical protein AB1Y20_014139 [Prymnesium parvum]|uniref:Uncharacterized protein n=1 Tax=Prymnesium parvum TaxID=97485 RepID=A0AB34IGW1_PRYPA
MAQVRRLVSLADEVRRPSPAAPPPATRVGPRLAPLLPPLLAYAGLNALSTAHAYRRAEAEAAARLAEGAEEAVVVLRQRSFSFSAELREAAPRDGAWTAVRLLPFVRLSDLWWGRSTWELQCHKRVRPSGGTHTMFTTGGGGGKAKAEDGRRGVPPFHAGGDRLATNRLSTLEAIASPRWRRSPRHANGNRFATLEAITSPR